MESHSEEADGLLLRSERPKTLSKAEVGREVSPSAGSSLLPSLPAPTQGVWPPRHASLCSWAPLLLAPDRGAFLLCCGCPRTWNSAADLVAEKADDKVPSFPLAHAA